MRIVRSYKVYLILSFMVNPALNVEEIDSKKVSILSTLLDKIAP